MQNIISERNKRGFLFHLSIEKKTDRRGCLGVKTKQNCIIERNNILNNLKKVVTEKVVKSRKPQKYTKSGFFLPQRN